MKEVHINWEGLARFLGWKGSIDDLKRLPLDFDKNKRRVKSNGR